MRGPQATRTLRVLLGVRGHPVIARQLPAVSIYTRSDGVGLRTFTTGKVRLSAGPTVKNDGSKLWDSADEAVADIKSESTILSSGFGLCGVAGTSPLPAPPPSKHN